MNYILQVELLSDACFSSGAGFAGEVDTDIEHDDFTGLPMVGGKTIKGLLVEECATILDVLTDKRWLLAAKNLFGDPGRESGAGLAIGNAHLPAEVQQAVCSARTRPANPLTARQILKSMTAIRRQTKIAHDGVPEEHSLRATRVALRGLSFFASFDGIDVLKDDEKALLAACVLATRRGGLNRNRGWGRLRLRLLDRKGQDITSQWIAGLQTD